MEEFNVNDFENTSPEFNDKTGEELYAEFLDNVDRVRDEYVHIHSGYLDVTRRLTSAAKDILFWMAINTDVNTGRVFVQSMVQRVALQELGITVGTYYKALNQLKEHNLLKGENAVYYVNPVYIWKGTADARAKFLRVYPRLHK